VGLQENQNYELKTRLEVEITLPSLIALDVGGASEGTVQGFRNEKELKIKVGGASKVDGSLTVDRGDFLAGGASSLVLAGSAKSARIVVGGASQLKLGEFLLKEAAIVLEGASTAQLDVQSDSPFKARLSGASRLGGRIHAEDVDLELEGASHVALGIPAKDSKSKSDDASQPKTAEAAPDARTIKVVASGASHVDVARPAAENADVILSGASHATVAVRGTLRYDLSSASHLSYRGEPSSVKGKKSGGSMVSQRR
jgi:hypothetical protein